MSFPPNSTVRKRVTRVGVISMLAAALVGGGLTAAASDDAPVDLAVRGGAARNDGDRSATITSLIDPGTAKNVILLIGDGMGDSEITAARNYVYGAAGRLPGIDALPLTGQYTTYSLQKGTTTPDYVPDSAATGSAWATGTKTYDNAVSVDTYGVPQENLLELSKAAGLKTGVVTTSEIQDATPAVQLAHISARSCYGPVQTTANCNAEALENGGPGSITEQMLTTRPDVTLGGGAASFAQVAKAGAYKDLTLTAQAAARGYQMVGTKTELAAITKADQNAPLLGLFHTGNMDVRWKEIPATAGGANLPAARCQANPARTDAQPSLADMTGKAIELLDNENGFFLQVEGASIDKRDHSADACGQIGETIDLDEAVQIAMAYAIEHGDTSVFVTADHAHTSQIVDGNTPALSVNLLTEEGSQMKISYGTAAAGGSQQHTGSQLRIAGYGPQAANVIGLTDQTDLFFTIRNALGLRSTGELAPSSVTVTAGAIAVSTKENLDLAVTVTAGVAFSGTAELWDGATKIATSPLFEATAGTGENPLFEAKTSFREAGSGLATGRRQYTVKFVSSNPDLAGTESAPALVQVYFYDSPPTSQFYDEIMWLAESGITTGNADNGFGPAESVSRQAMAAFLYRLQNDGAAAPACTTSLFADVPVSSTFCGEVSWLKAEGIGEGFAGNTFRPGASIQRQAMAAFLYRVTNPGTAAPACTTAPFADVPATATFCGEIAWLKAEGIATGYAGNRFNPGGFIDRQAMAAFLFRLAA